MTQQKDRPIVWVVECLNNRNIYVPHAAFLTKQSARGLRGSLKRENPDLHPRLSIFERMEDEYQFDWPKEK